MIIRLRSPLPDWHTVISIATVVQEIVVPAAALAGSIQSFAVFRYEQVGQLREVLNWQENAYDRGIAVGLLDDDEYLDAVYLHNAHIRVLRGDGILFELENRQQALTPSFRDASLLDFDGDEHLDYVCASWFGATVYRGGDDAQFSDLSWFLEGDSVLTVSGADFNQTATTTLQSVRPAGSKCI